MSGYVDGAALLLVLLASLLGGVGLVAVFAVGMVGLSRYRSAPDGGGRSGGGRTGGSLAGLVLAVLCFGVVSAGVVVGLFVMLAKG